MPTTNLSPVRYSLADAIALEMLVVKGGPTTLNTILALLERRGWVVSRASVCKVLERNGKRFRKLERNTYQLVLNGEVCG